MTNKITWNEETTAQLTALVGNVEVVSQEALDSIALELGTSKRSIGSKLRKMGFEVQKASDVARTRWAPEQEAQLVGFLEQNSGAFTYAEVAAQFAGGAFSAKQIQGKVLSMELYAHVRATEKVAAPRTYSEAEEVQFVELANRGASLEAIAGALGKSIQSVRGKSLSLFKSGEIDAIPSQENSHAKSRVDVLEGINLASMTVEQIAAATEKSARGIKSMLTHRGLACADYDGAAKRAKLDAQA